LDLGRGRWASQKLIPVSFRCGKIYILDGSRREGWKREFGTYTGSNDILPLARLVIPVTAVSVADIRGAFAVEAALYDMGRADVSGCAYLFRGFASGHVDFVRKDIHHFQRYHGIDLSIAVRHLWTRRGEILATYAQAVHVQ
jgi:hypothetical protein